MSEHLKIPDDLIKLDAIIDQNKKDCVVVGRTLKEIRDRELVWSKYCIRAKPFIVVCLHPIFHHFSIRYYQAVSL